MADMKQGADKREVKPMSINRRIKKSNSELLGKVQVYVVNKKNNKTYLFLKNFEIIVKNSMFNHSKLEMVFQVALKDEFTAKKMENIKLASDISNLLYQDKQYIGVDLSTGKTLFYGIIEKLEYDEKSRIYKLRASSISKLLDRIPQYVDFKTGYSLDFFLKKMQAKIHRYLSNDAMDQGEEIALSQIDFDIKDEELEFNSIMKYGYIIMYNETYWEFLKKIMYFESFKIPVYVKEKSIVIGFSKKSEEEENIIEKIKLNFETKNQIREIREIGDYYAGYCIYKSKIVIKDTTGTEYYYASATLDEIVNELKVTQQEVDAIQLVGKVESVENMEKVDEIIEEKKQFLINFDKELEKRKLELKQEEHDLLSKEQNINISSSKVPQKEIEEKRKQLSKRLENIEKILNQKLKKLNILV